MQSAHPIDPDLVAAYQTRTVAVAADLLVALLRDGPRPAQDVLAIADAALLTRRAVKQAAEHLHLRRRAGWRLPGPNTRRMRQARRDSIAGPVLCSANSKV